MLLWIADPFKHQKHDNATQTPSEGQKLDVEHAQQETANQKEDEKRDHEMQEAEPIELFYDLFFVANLTTVTGVHYITETQSKMIAPLLLLTYGEFIFL